MIPVTKPFLPPQEEYNQYLEGIWKRNWLTNMGPLANKLELDLKEFLEVPHLLWLTNGTVAIQIAMKALDVKGDIITTPFSFVATTSSIVWEGCTPVFVDIDQETLNIDPNKIEAAITPKTTAILATHVYGNPCDHEKIDAIAKKHKLKVIYDAAHAFGVKYKGKSLYRYGDISTSSFHATKIYHTIEGGAVFSENPDLIKRMSFMRNFGFQDTNFPEVGINGKNSEFHAAMGLVNLKYVKELIKKRKQQSAFYDDKLKELRHTKPRILADTEYNYSYYAIILESEEMLLKAISLLNGHWIYPRRYFYPVLNLPIFTNTPQPMPIAEDIAKRVLCLPVYHDLAEEDMELIARLLLRAQNY